MNPTDNFFSIYNHTYYFSVHDLDNLVVEGDPPKLVSQIYTWIEARNKCRKRCMELVSFDSRLEFEVVAALLTHCK